MAELKYIAYLRVSTSKQEKSGLGLEAQRTIIEHYAKIDGATIVKEVVEAISGKDIENRPLLKAAIAECIINNCHLIVAKLDRLSRDVEHIFKIQKQLGSLFISCDLPSTDALTLSIFAGLAQREREIISLRTKSALSELKKQGVHLGKAENFKGIHRAKGADNAAKKTNEFRTDRKLTSMVESCQRDGMTNEEIAAELNNHGFKSYRGKSFNSQMVYRLIQSSIQKTNEP